MAQPIQNNQQGMLSALDSQIAPPQQNPQQQPQNAAPTQQVNNPAGETQRNQALAAQGIGQNINQQA